MMKDQRALFFFFEGIAGWIVVVVDSMSILAFAAAESEPGLFGKLDDLRRLVLVEHLRTLDT